MTAGIELGKGCKEKGEFLWVCPPEKESRKICSSCDKEGWQTGNYEQGEG